MQYRSTFRAIAQVIGGFVMLGLIGFALYQEFGGRPKRPTAPIYDSWQAPQQDSEPPPGYTVKGNISVTTGEKLYHVPGMRDYEETVIDLDRGERWFRTEQEAVAAGWRRAVPR